MNSSIFRNLYDLYMTFMKICLLILVVFSPLNSIQAKDSVQVQNARILIENKDYEAAYDILSSQKNHCDTMFIRAYDSRVGDLRAIYNVAELKRANHNQQILLISYISGLALIVALLLFVWYLYLKKQSSKLRLNRKLILREKMRAQDAVKSKSILLSTMSHEIKTPLNAVVGFSRLIGTGDLDRDMYAEVHSIIELNSHQLIKLMDEVMMPVNCLADMNVGIEKCECEVVALCRRTAESVRKIKTTDAEIRFVTDFPSLRLSTDASRLQQVLTNLIVNATKFTQKGYIELRLEPSDAGFVRFSVTDTGCGIPREKQNAVFSRYEKLQENMQGTGLGLSICKRIIENLGGKIFIDPSYTAGARFVFTHPLNNEIDICCKE